MHPLDFRAVFLAKHAQQVVLIHFPIASLIVGVVFDFWGQWTKQHLLKAAAYYNVFVAALTTVPALLTRVLAWQWALEGPRRKGIVLMHRVFGCMSSILIWTVWVVHRRAQRKHGAGLPVYRLPIEAVAVAMVTVTGTSRWFPERSKRTEIDRPFLFRSTGGLIFRNRKWRSLPCISF